MKKVLIFALVILSVLSFSKVTIEFWHAMSGWRIELLENMAKEFMATHPNIEIRVQYTGSYRDTFNKTIAAVKAGNPPHVVQIYDIGTRAMIDGNIAVPIGNLIEEDPTIDLGAFLPQVLNYYTVDGKLYSMPFNSSNAILFYNKTAFKEAGLDPKRPPRTFDELIEYSRKLVKKDEKGNIIRYGLTWPTHSWFFEQLMAVQDAPLVNNDNGRGSKRPDEAVFNSEAGKRIFELLAQMTKEGLLINTKREDWSGARQIFLSGKAAMLLYSTSDVKFITETAKKNGWEVGTAFLPKPSLSIQGGVVIGGGSLWILKNHPKKEIDAAWEFVKWMTEPKQQIRWHNETGYFPVRKDAVEQLLMEGFYAEKPNYLTAIFQLLLSKQTPNTNGAIIGVFPETREIIETAYEKVINGQMTVEQALNWAAGEVTKALKKYNRLYK
ncbi:glycerol-3-phosphate ABC transporter substrate-binding protein [Thermosipho affectus]|uniref:Glycerol-3-phosphate ABC transporter substrate-binding protein n=1 Tax=Thermosipho affectus TaxID=660294 RepID=A0ABX3IIQ2_9BACT|nr:ABC transporter substrate-binding protein [Thermosipho affectus]ONN27084.1 glycerol-3-phosphate ABC transporter substrate-binding protein [Thermosipho affectus]